MDTPGTRRAFLAATSAVGVATVAGCLGGDGGGTQTETPGGDGTTMGTTKTTPSGPSGPVKVGVLAPAPTKNPIGASIANAARLAAEQLNANGGILGADVQVIVKDTKEKPSVGESKYQQLTVGSNVDFTTGVFTSEVLLGLMQNIARQRTVHLGAGAASPRAAAKLRNNYEKYKWWFRAGPVNSHYLGVSLVDFAKANFADMGWDRIGVLAEDYVWSKPVTDVLRTRLGEVGVDIPVNKRYASGTKNFTPLYDDLESANVDGAFTVMAHTGTPAVVQWFKQQRPFGFGGIHVPMQLPSYYRATNGACRYAFTQNSATPNSKWTKKTVPFANAYHEAYDSYPVYTGYITFDAVKMYAAAAEKAGTVDDAAIVDTLEDMSFLSTTGTLKFYPKDHQYPHDVVYGRDAVYPLYHQWKPVEGEGKNGRQVSFWPQTVKAGSYEQPPWVPE